MHHGQPLTQLGQVADNRVGIGFLTLVSAPPLRDALPKKLGLADKGGFPGTQINTTVERGYCDAECGPPGEKVPPVGNGLREKVGLGQILQQNLSPTLALCAEQHRALMILNKSFEALLVALVIAQLRRGLECCPGMSGRLRIYLELKYRVIPKMSVNFLHGYEATLRW